MLTSASLLTAENQTVDAATGVRYTFRRFGHAADATVPLVCFQHFRGNIDDWDPALVDALARGREVIVFDNAGVASSTGCTPRTFTQMARDALAFVDALGLPLVDVLGFSIGGMVAQELALIRPTLIRRLVLAGTAPQGGREIHGFTPEVHARAMAGGQNSQVLFLFFSPSATSQTKGVEFQARTAGRKEGRDQPTDLRTRDAQLDAFTTWGIPDPTKLGRLAGIRIPVLVAHGDHDIMIPTPNSYLLAGHLPDARLTIYPDAGHGFLFQYPDEFAAEVTSFLEHG